MFYEIVTKRLIPDIYEKMADFDVVFVQMDNVRPHVKRIADLELFGKKRKRTDWKQMPLIKFVLQPANSPDTNLNDLCFFRSLSKLVQERSNTALPTRTSFGTSLWSNTINSMPGRHLRDTGTSKPQSISASSTRTERTIQATAPCQARGTCL